jgi:hypothetical protein
MQVNTKKPEFKIFGGKDGVVWGAVQIKDNYPHPVKRETAIESIPKTEFTMNSELPTVYGAFLSTSKKF